MRNFILWLLLYFVFLVWLWPYQATVQHAVQSFETSTGAQVTYQPVSAGPLGVQMRDLHVSMPSGIEVSFDHVRVNPSFGGFKATLSQKTLQSTVTVRREKIQLQMDEVEFDSGTHELGRVTTSGNLTYDTKTKAGEGPLRMAVPKFQAPLPIDSLELGTTLNLVDHGQGTEVSLDVHAVGVPELTGDGNIRVVPQPGQPGKLSGTLAIRTALIKKGTLRIEGTWRKPTWSVVNASSN